MRPGWKIVVALVLVSVVARAEVPGNMKDAEAVEDVNSGKMTTANAAWWGFDREDSTEALQTAIDSGAKMLIVPYMGEPWIVRPLRLHGDLEIRFEPGVVILAKKGEYRGGGDSLFTADDVENLTMRGYGATLRMHKRDYQKAPYEKAEWRTGISLGSCKNVLIEGLRIESTGGDGIYVGRARSRNWCEGVTIRDCTFYDNHRQGISVITAKDLLIENCLFANTWGTPPEAGIDLEPNREDERLENCVVRDSTFENNNGSQVLIYLKQMDRTTHPLSIRFERCRMRMTDARRTAPEPGSAEAINGWGGVSVAAVRDDGPKGLIEFVDCVMEDTSKECVRISDKSAEGVRVRFANCSFSNPWINPNANEAGPRVPIMFYAKDPEITKKPGGVEFDSCYVYDRIARPAARFETVDDDIALREVKGELIVRGPGTSGVKFGPHTKHVDVSVIAAEKKE